MTHDTVRALAGRRGGVWSLLVLQGDDTVVEERAGCAEDDLFYTFSVTKPFTALAVHLLAHRGQLDLDEPIAAHWPAYAVHGKGTITPRHVLSHTAGVRLSTPWPATEMLALRWPRLSVQLAQRATPTSPPGQVQSYHLLSFGYILGELVRRVDGRPIERFVAEEFFAPLGLEHSFLSLPRDRTRQAVPLHGVDRGGRAVAWALNRPGCRRAVAPAASLQTTARDLARFYRTCLRNGRTDDGREVIPPDALTAAHARVRPEFLRYATGFQRGGMGGRCHDIAFGHNGSNVCTVWADPVVDVVFVYLTDRYDTGHESWLHMAEVSDAVLAEFAA